MKKLIKTIIPSSLIRWYRRFKVSQFRNMPTHEVFTKIYKDNHWKSSESISGSGSEIKHTQTLRKGLEQLLDDKNITSVLDIPCGDFAWMQKVDLSNIAYTGADIVEELIKNNEETYRENDNLEFKVLNLITDPLPKNDLLIVRDCLVHLSNADILSAIENIKSSGSNYLLTTTFTSHNLNINITTGEWRPINLQEKPFNFPNPMLVINENYMGDTGIYKDKSMALWEISEI